MRERKNKRTTLVLIAALIISALSAAAALAWSGALTAHATGTTAAAVILPGDANARAVVQAFNVTSDKAGSKLAVYWADGLETTVDAASASTTLNVAVTTGFAAGNLVAVAKPDGRVIWRTVSAVTVGESLTLSTALASGYGEVGDRVMLLAAAAANTDAEIPVGAATKELSNPLGVIAGPKDSPLLLQVDGTSACAVNYLTWSFK